MTDKERQVLLAAYGLMYLEYEKHRDAENRDVSEVVRLRESLETFQAVLKRLFPLTSWEFKKL